MQISEPGLYPDVPEADYHADPVATPSLSSSICKLIVERSPEHAWYAHPRLNPEAASEVEKAPTRGMDFGTAAHKLLLGRGRDLVEIAAADYKTKAAQQERDAARAAGKVPMLADDMAAVRSMVEAARRKIGRTELADVFDTGEAEITGVVQDRLGGWRRIRVDWLPASARKGGHIVAVDVKTTGGSASPEDWQRTAFDMGYDIQAAFYMQALSMLLPDVRSVSFKFLVVEQDPPHGVTVNEFSGQALEEAHNRVDHAAHVWALCMKRGQWPGYPADITRIDPPKWRSEKAEMQRLSMFRLLEAWQAPLSIDQRNQAAE